jgi:hypothetical protein
VTDYSSVLSKFDKLKRYSDRGYWQARCPAHDDHNPSCLIWVGRKGVLMARCFANRGCTWKAIVAATGTEETDWFPEIEKRAMKPTNTGQVKPRIVATYPYRNEKGEMLYECLRLEPAPNGDKKSFRYRRPNAPGSQDPWTWNLDGVDRVLYRLPELCDPANAGRMVCVVEGEKDVETLCKLGLLATTNPCGAGNWLPDYGRCLRGRHVAIIPDNDRPGQSHAITVAGNLVYWGAASLRIVNLHGLAEGEDVSDWLSDFPKDAAPEKKKAALVNCIKAAPEWRSHFNTAKN